MHAVMRRVPVERARHAKRLGHVQTGPGAVLPVVAGGGNGKDGAGATTTQQPTIGPTPSQATPILATSAIHSSSGSLPSSSITSSSSSALSSSATSSTLSEAFSASTQPLNTPTPSSLIGTIPPSTSPVSSSTPTPQPHSAAVSNNGLSGGAIAGIIAGAAIVGAAIIVFFVRKTYLRRRERKRISWNGAPGLGAGILDEPKPFPDTNERPTSFIPAVNTSQRHPPPSPFAAHAMYSVPASPLAHMQHPAVPPYAVPAPPQATYNNPTPVAAYPTHAVPSAYGPGNPSTYAMARVAPGTGIPPTLPPSARAQHAPMEATVKCTFVPNLPDELSITTGERIFIVEQYDDGWDLCANARGERGMVPQECLEHAPINQPDAGWRAAGRTSSLNPDEKRY